MALFKQWKINRLQKKIKALKAFRKLNQPDEKDIAMEASLYFTLAQMYHDLIGHKKYPFAHISERLCYESCADMDQAGGHYKLGKSYLDEALFRSQIQKQEVLDSESNHDIVTQLFDKAHKHLKTATQMGHILAERLLGLVYIRGMGVPVDVDLGLDHIVASIEREGSFDKLPEIFKKMGLDKPEYFTKVMNRKKS